MFNDSILYNIGYGGISNEEVKECIDNPSKQERLISLIAPAAKRASIHNFIMDKQKGYWEQVGERGLKLSGGER